MSVISGGDISRAIAKHNNHAGILARDLINKGILLPDEILNDEVNHQISKHFGRGMLFDGYPRTLPQAKHLFAQLKKYNHPLVVINLQLKDTESIKRLEMRLICSKCGDIVYPKHVVRNAQEYFYKLLNRCTHCGGKLVKRSDDNESAIKQRLAQFHHETDPVIRYFDEIDCLINVDAKPEIEIVADSVKTALIEKLK